MSGWDGDQDLSKEIKNWKANWKEWVPDPAKIYVAGESGLSIKVNPIFRGTQRQPPIEPDLCSVLIPFHEPFLSIYADCIRPPLELAGFRVMKADEDIFSPGEDIIQEIWKLISRSSLMVADVTGKNPNVFYELGIAHTVGRDVIIITQNEQDVPFDIRNYQYFQYTANNDEGKQKLRSDLGNLLKDVKLRTSQP